MGAGGLQSGNAPQHPPIPDFYLKYEIPEIMEITESRCGNNNEENFILKYNNSSLSIVGDIKERQNLDKSKNGSILKKGIKKFLKTINYLILTYNV